MVRIAILGATGYTALELLKLLIRHPETEIVALTSRENTQPVDLVHPSLTGEISLRLENSTPQEILERGVDCVFSCLPHTATAAVAPAFLDGGAKVIDFGADYRLDSAEVFQKWYGVEHPDAERLPRVPYGLPELFRAEILKSNIVANPGCYPTSAILPLAPILRAGYIEPTDIIIDSKSGVSGAGRKPSLKNLYPECNEAISAYGIGTHRHTPEIELIISKFAGQDAKILFTPHLTPMDRGILTTAYSRIKKPGLTQNDVLNLLRKQYENEPFVRIVEAPPTTKDVIHTNRCHITARVLGDRLVTISVIDNLIKGASGAAVQNFNLLFGYPEETALK
ncbi:MAG: N-acetyl-gamma-glutamyl-phosphate reductase [Thermoguttaceae bacterium]|nr:N-acetyl-gamma-glutamyl-phosphate reductase [Thermoguttaceae bacterium]